MPNIFITSALCCAGRGESCGEEWELVLMEGGEEEANCNSGSGDSSREQVHIAIMRRRTSKKDSHISDVRPATRHTPMRSVHSHSVSTSHRFWFGRPETLIYLRVTH